VRTSVDVVDGGRDVELLGHFCPWVEILSEYQSENLRSRDFIGYGRITV
jgi:hypothetical protein